MAKLNRIAMELLRTSNKPENIKGIAEKGYAYDYADYLVSVGDELPEVIYKWIAEKGNSQKTANLVLKMKAKDMEVSPDLIKNIVKTSLGAMAYAIEKYDFDPESEMEPEVFEAIVKDGNTVRQFIAEFITKDIDATLIPLDKWNQFMDKMTPFIGADQLYYKLVKRLIEAKVIKGYKQINRKAVETILKHEETVNKFAHFLLPYVNELPEEVKSKVTNQNILKPDWRKVTKFEENFSNFFSKK